MEDRMMRLSVRDRSRVFERLGRGSERAIATATAQTVKRACAGAALCALFALGSVPAQAQLVSGQSGGSNAGGGGPMGQHLGSGLGLSGGPMGSPSSFGGLSSGGSALGGGGSPPH